ncbi:MAG: ferredoxin--NADP reductase [Mycobacteriaceae bacterium]|nr:ferredoxin--NADP reductase [Mycobacteriaceae bacterium]
MAITHVFHRATVARIIKETADACTFVLIPDEQPFPYRAGQYCTFRVTVDGEELYRSYSMSSAPEIDPDLATTVKRVPTGKVSNWLLDNLAEGDDVVLTRPAGTFCLDSTSAPLLGFAGGSGVTPILSLTKSALATTNRQVRLLCADRDRASVIFESAMAELVERFPDRLEVVRHIDAERGLIDAAAVRTFVGPHAGADCYVCGPEGFMTVVRSTLPGPGRVFVENFDVEPKVRDTVPTAAAQSAASGTVTIHLDRKKISVPHVTGETLLESARRGGLSPPFSCEAGNCGTCIGKLSEGHATMRNNEVLEDDEIADGYILTCQGVPDTDSVTVIYE